MAQVLAGILVALLSVSTLGVVRVTEGGLRAQTTAKVLPQYPSDALAAKVQGIAVAMVKARPDGTVVEAQSLEAPSPAIAAAMKEALLKWRIPQIAQNSGMDTQGKVTIYFRIQNGRGVVLEPNQIPGNEGAFDPPAKRAPGWKGKPPEQLNTTALKAMPNQGRVIHLSVDDRDAPMETGPDRIRIPFDEVWTRARAELPATATVVVDCRTGRLSQCAQSGMTLLMIGFERVFILVP